MARPPSTVVKATAPLGGCRQRSANIAPIDRQTAAPAAGTGSGIRRQQVMPTSADTRLPPTIDQGWASGLAGTANSSNAEAPIGASNDAIAEVVPSVSRKTNPVITRPRHAPTLP